MRRIALWYLAAAGSFGPIDPGLHKIAAEVAARDRSNRSAESEEDIMKRNTVQRFIANKITGRFSLLLIGMAIASSPATFAADHVNSTTMSHLDECSLAIVTRQPLGSAHICDPKTVRSLAQHGHIYEQNQMGMVSMLAIGPDYSPAEALKWFEQSARKGYPPAQVNLAVMYINGWGTPQNYGPALHWLLEAAHQGYARAYYNLGILYQQGEGVAANPTEAVRYYRLGADAGDSGAETNLGYMYDHGLGVAKDLAAAVSCYRRAADRGNALAQNNLADLYLRGEGVPQDDAMAFGLFQKAAAQGQTGARIKLAYLYANGRGVRKDLVTADSWITAAATSGDPRGIDLQRAIEKQLSASQTAQAKETAKKLNPEGDPELSARALQP
jgi:uncharacterized protein